jgi:hypothetical protein
MTLVCAALPASAPAGNGTGYGTKKESAKVEKKVETSRMNWEPVMDAIIQVESEGDRLAKSGNQVGAMQIKPILVKECNRILELQNSKKRFALNDRYSIRKSKEMFLVIQSFYNTKNDVEYAIRSWNGGHNYSQRATQRYYEKVTKLLNDIS